MCQYNDVYCAFLKPIDLLREVIVTKQFHRDCHLFDFAQNRNDK